MATIFMPWSRAFRAAFNKAGFSPDFELKRMISPFLGTGEIKSPIIPTRNPKWTSLLAKTIALAGFR